LGWPGLGTLGGPALLALACLALVAIYSLFGVLSVTSNYATIKVGQQMVNDFRSELYAHLQRLSLAFHSRRQVGDLLYRLTADTFAIQTLTMNGFFPVVTSVVLLVGMLAVMLRLDWVLTLIALAIVPLLFVAIAGLSRRITALATDARTKESALWAIAQRTMSAIRVIQAFTTEEDEHRRFVASSSASLTANLRLYTFQTGYSAFVNVLVAGGTAAVLWFGAMHVLAGKLTVGEVVAVVGATGAGKTTLVSLVPRFYDPTAGRVLLDGIDVREFRLKALRQQVAIVLQPALVFPTTVRENIAYGRPDASVAMVEA